MKKIIFFALVCSGALFASCNKLSESVSVPSQMIRFNLGGDGMDFDVRTKATEVTAVSKIYWEAADGSGVKHSVARYDVSGGTVATGKYWPAAGATYTYYVSNESFTTGTRAIAATNATDIVAGTKSGVSDNTAEVTLDHIFARTGTLTLNTQSGYTLSDVSWKIASKGDATGTAGTYTIGSGWGSTATATLAEQAFTGSSDLYLIPGTYTVTVSYTLTKGDYTEDFTKSAEVTLVQGKVNSITGTATGGSATEITFSVKVTAWGDNAINANFN